MTVWLETIFLTLFSLLAKTGLVLEKDGKEKLQITKGPLEMLLSTDWQYKDGNKPQVSRWFQAKKIAGEKLLSV